MFCFNDQIAMGVMQAASALGLEVPRDCSVVGVDDLEIVAAALEPGLTTVALPHREMGRWGMATLLDRIDGIGSTSMVRGSRCCSRAQLVERGSVGPPPVDRLSRRLTGSIQALDRRDRERREPQHPQVGRAPH